MADKELGATHLRIAGCTLFERTLSVSDGSFATLSEDPSLTLGVRCSVSIVKC